MTTIVGISGHLGAGKDTLAHRLVVRHGFVRVGFADSLKFEVATTLRRTLLAYAGERGMIINTETDDQVIHDMLWDNRTPMTRALLQEWGTELRRRQDPDYWVTAWRRAAERFPRVVVPDVRFTNEVNAIRELGGALVKVVRPGHEGDSHASESLASGWQAWDHVFTNGGTIDDLQRALDVWWFAQQPA